eukprot:GEMP01004403.1.p1 GENE.GEMP01004403.1~~GEMP01004403.1.p1  ORF type:complete len:784 (+),score=125.83 GEMP01004403.1:579-2930(+)
MGGGAAIAFTIENFRKVAWNVDKIPFFRDRMYYEIYGGTSGAVTQQRTSLSTAPAYDDLYYRDINAVINYRANRFKLMKERLDLVGGSFVLSDLEPGTDIFRLFSVLDFATDLVAKDNTARLGTGLLTRLAFEEVERRRRHPVTIDIDVNVDYLFMKKFAPEDWYATICMDINVQIEEAHRRAGSVARATVSLQLMANEETMTANKYARFNEPDSREILQLDFNTEVPMRQNIDTLYERAMLRREEFHKMSAPTLVSNAHSNAYRVHFTDPEHRYVRTETTIAQKSKQWYKLTWESFIEPIFKDTVIDDMKDIHSRNIILVDSDSEHRSTLAYVTKDGLNIIVHCAFIDGHHATADRTIRHEYEHVVDSATHSRTSTRYKEMENGDDLRTLFKNTLEQRKEIANFNIQKIEDRLNSGSDKFLLAEHEGLRETRDNLASALEDIESKSLFTYNADDCSGFPSTYARFSEFEAVAEQRYAMRNDARRITLLRRMSRYATPGPHQADALQQKKMYDIAREEMENVSSKLHNQWGENYDGRPAEEWGLSPGEAKKTDKHYSIMALDNTLATKMASERLAVELLQKGYDCAVMAYDFEKTAAGIQSNMQESPLHGSNPINPTFNLLLVGGGNMDGKAVGGHVAKTFLKFTPTGRRRNPSGNPYHFGQVIFARPPGSSLLSPDKPNEKVGVDIVEKLKLSQLFYSETPQAISVHDKPIGVNHEGAIVEVAPRGEREKPIWPENKDLYKDTVHGERFADDGIGHSSFFEFSYVFKLLRESISAFLSNLGR